MPKENKKRGRRGEKRKHEEPEDTFEYDAGKRRKSVDATFEEEQNYIPMDAPEQQDQLMEDAPAYDRPFFGMLDEEEQEYFKRMDDMLEMNSFADPEERAQFLASVYREADGKELKIALSQSCSRLMERLIKVSTASQLKGLFQKFSGNFLHLISHRFASHACEALFMRAAPVVSHELREKAPTVGPDEVYVTMENLFLHTLSELEGSIGYLMTEPQASHVLRTLVMVLAGEPFDSTSTQHLLKSKRKETVTIQNFDESHLKGLEQLRSVPKSFTEALRKLISESIAGFDTDKLRAYATHTNANPTLQVLLKIELTHFGKQRAKDEASIIHTLLPDDPITAESGSAKFISGIVYDSTGSHLVEKIVEHAPGKMFKSLYKEFFKERMASFARNEIAGYVVCRILERLGKDDLLEASQLLAPSIPSLLERGRTVVIQTLVERCAVRDINTKAIANEIGNAYGGLDSFDIVAFLKDSETPHDSAHSSSMESSSAPPSARDPSKVHFNLLAQSMLKTRGPLSKVILDSLIALKPKQILSIAKDSVTCHTLQAALASPNATIIERRKLIHHFYGSIGEMALNKFASHVVDRIWDCTHDLAFIRERIAEELAENEANLRESPHGRAVWKNWKMDMYKRRRTDWIRESKSAAGNDNRFQSFSEVDKHKDASNGPVVKKTPLQLAREKHAKAKAERAKADGKGFGSGANGRPVAT